MAVRTNTNISGIITGQTEHKIALYAGDVILFTSHLDRTIPALLELISLFSGISEYTINDTKSSILPLNEDKKENSLPEVSPFKVLDQLVYLGIRIRSRLDLLVKINHEPLMEEITQLVNRWMSWIVHDW